MFGSSKGELSNFNPASTCLSGRMGPARQRSFAGYSRHWVAHDKWGGAQDWKTTIFDWARIGRKSARWFTPQKTSLNSLSFRRRFGIVLIVQLVEEIFHWLCSTHRTNPSVLR